MSAGFAELSDNLATGRLYLIHRTQEPLAVEAPRELWLPDDQPAQHVTFEQACAAEPSNIETPHAEAWIVSQEWSHRAFYTLPGVNGFVGWQLLSSVPS